VETADLVIVGGGTIGGWCSCFAREAGAGRVVVLERGTVGCGASSRAAGIVRAQGGTRTAVELARFSIDFYESQRERLGVDSGFVRRGYLILAVTAEERDAAHRRVEMQRAAGLDAEWVEPGEAARLNPTLAEVGYLGATYAEPDGAIDAPRNVLAYRLAMERAGVELRERTPVAGLRIEPGAAGPRVTAVETPDGAIATDTVVLAGGPGQRGLGRLADVRAPVGTTRHTVAVTSPDPAFAVESLPMVFDLGSGLYWRQEEDGLLFGVSNPGDVPGEAREIDPDDLAAARGRLGDLVPAAAGLGLRKAWAATIDYTSDHLPILGPALTAEGEPIGGLWVASAAGHGMMWGPGVARAAADLALRGATRVTDVSVLGLDRFDPSGVSRLAADPIALPFPIEIHDDETATVEAP
jgi:sarcosine oxidase subunit beta